MINVIDRNVALERKAVVRITFFRCRIAFFQLKYVMFLGVFNYNVLSKIIRFFKILRQTRGLLMRHPHLFCKKRQLIQDQLSFIYINIREGEDINMREAKIASTKNKYVNIQ